MNRIPPAGADAAPGLLSLGWSAAWRTAFDGSVAACGPAGLVPARVVEEHRDGWRVVTSACELRAQVAGRLRHAARGPDELPAVGDWVAVDVRAAEGAATIQAVLPRRSALLRKEAGGRTAAQVVAANVDHVLCVTGLDLDFNLRRIERYVALVWESGAQPVLVLGKADLCADAASRAAAAESVAPGVPVLVLSARTGAGVEALEPFLRSGTTSALVGSSGAGKSTLLNRVAGREVLATGEVRGHDGRGRHTTTHRQLVALPGRGCLVDTPGLREILPWSGDSGVAAAFDDLEELARSCRFADCGHEREPGCAVRGALDEGSLDPARLESWRRIGRELAHLARKQDARARREWLQQIRARARLHEEGRRRGLRKRSP